MLSLQIPLILTKDSHKYSSMMKNDFDIIIGISDDISNKTTEFEL